MRSGNLFEHIPSNLPDEITETLSASGHARIERIVSTGQASPPGFWYDQDQAEWVLLVQGEAKLEFDGRTVHLRPGDYLDIPAHVRHRVAWTKPDEPTIWLAVFDSPRKNPISALAKPPVNG